MKIAVLLFVFSSFFVWKYESNPERILRNQYNLCFEKAYPGATDHYVQYTAYYCDDKSKAPVQKGLDLGGEWVELHLRNHNGGANLVLEPRVPWGSGECVTPVESVWSLEKQSKHDVHLTLISSTKIDGPCAGFDGQ